MSIENMNKSGKPSAKEIETMSREQIEYGLASSGSPDNAEENRIRIAREVVARPYDYSVEFKDETVIIKKKATGSTVYFSNDPQEIEGFKKIEKYGSV